MTFSPFKCQFLNSQFSKTKDIAETLCPCASACTLHPGCNFHTCLSSASKHFTCDQGKMHPSCQRHQARCVGTGQSKLGAGGGCTVKGMQGRGVECPLAGAVGVAQPSTSSRTSPALVSPHLPAPATWFHRGTGITLGNQMSQVHPLPDTRQGPDPDLQMSTNPDPEYKRAREAALPYGIMKIRM